MTDTNESTAVRAILFDNDGTLVDTHDLLLASFRHATHKVLGSALPDEVLMAKVGQPLAVQMRDFSDDPAVQNELLRVYREFNHTHHDEAVTLFPGVRDGLERLREAGFSMGVVTSKMSPLAKHGLEILGVAEYFDCLVGADSCKHHKPHPEPVELGAKLLGMSASECAFVGDSPFDMEAGREAGCITAAVLWGMFPETRLVAERPTHVCGTFDELVDALLSHREPRRAR